MLPKLNEDISVQKQLADEKAEIINRLDNLNKKIEGAQETHESAFSEMQNELDNIVKDVAKFMERYAEPLRCVSHPVALTVADVDKEVALAQKNLNLKRSRAAEDEELNRLLSIVWAEMTVLDNAVNDAQKIADDNDVDLMKLDSTLEEVRSAMEHLNLAEGYYKSMSELPNADAACGEVLDKLSKYGDDLRTLESVLEDRQTNLIKFNETALSAEQRLNELANECSEVEAANAESGVPKAAALINSLDETRNVLKQLENEIDDLGQLKTPTMLVASLKKTFDELEERLKKADNKLQKEKEEKDAEKALEETVNDLEGTLLDAENALSQIDASIEPLDTFKNSVLETLRGKVLLVMENVPSISTPYTAELCEKAEVLKKRTDDLMNDVNAKLTVAVEQDNLQRNVENELTGIRQEIDAFATKYESAKELSTAIEDLKRLHEINNRLNRLAVDDVTDRQKQSRLNKERDVLKHRLEELQTPLEKDVTVEQDILMELRDVLSEFTSIGDEVVAIETSGEGNEQLKNLSKLGEELHALKNRVEALEDKMLLPEGKVQHSPVDENLSERVTGLQQAMEAKKQQLQTSVKLKALCPAIDSVAENVRSTLKRLETSVPEKLEDQEATLHDLEAKKQQLERLIEGIPDSGEGDELRNRALSWLERLSEQLKRLGAAVGDKLAAIAAFVAMRNEVDAQLASLELEPAEAVDDLSTVPSCNDRLEKVEV